MSASFAYTALASHVVFGPGSFDRVPEEVERLGCDRVLILASPRLADLVARAQHLLGARAVGLFDGAVEQTPVEVSERALVTLRSVEADCVLAIGGGSAVGLGKALAARADVVQIAVPTTYSGSEVTPVLGETEHGVKTTRSSPALLPESVIYDVALSVDLPAALAVCSAVNAMAHAVEACYSPDANPLTDAVAARSLRALRAGLQAVADGRHDVDSASELLLGAWLAGSCLGTVRMGLHHKLCHTLGGSFGLPHAPTHTVLLPHALAYNAAHAPAAVRQVADALDTDDPAAGLHDLVRSAGGPTSLRGLGLAEADLDRVAELAVAHPYPNPRPLDRDGIRGLLDDAWSGRPPSAPTAAGP